MRLACAITMLGLLTAAPPARAQIDIEVPVVVLDDAGGGDQPVDDAALELANVVETAARAVTTIQEAPAIVTVVTADDIRERGFTSVDEIVDSVPGWLRVGALQSMFAFPLSRGMAQSSMFMVNGVSMFDSMFNAPTVGRIQPVETIKRIEMITGPGGVLWGANSYLGIINVISWDAEDVDGVVADVGGGHGNGDREYMRGYVMAGLPDLLDGRADLLLHTSFESYLGPGYQLPLKNFSQPLPQPNSRALYGPLTTANPPRSFLFNFDGRLTMGGLDLLFSAPMVERHLPLGISGYVINQDHAEDSAILCESETEPGTYVGAQPGGCPVGYVDTGRPACPQEEPYLDFEDECIDKGRAARDNRADFFERYLVGRYRTRMAGGRAGLTFKAYGIQFVRDFRQLGILHPISGLLEGGLAFGFDGTNYRVGGAADGDIDLPAGLLVLYGAEGFHEWLPNRVTRSIQGDGVEAHFAGPYDLSRLPLPCPRTLDPDTGQVTYLPGCPLTSAFTASRTVLGAYLNPRWQLSRRLTVDGGARVQVAPESLGVVGFAPEPLFSGALVYELAPRWYGKLTYAEGFRPPVFNNTNSNGDSIQIDGRPDLEVERSQAGQVEINARLFKGERRLRELAFRTDYSYTRLDNLIQVVNGRYDNTGRRDLHSVEFLGRLFLQGGHHVDLGYTWLRVASADTGRIRSLPEHWFNLSTVFELTGWLELSSNLRVLGATEDPNRMVEYRGYGYDQLGRSVNCGAACTPGFTNAGEPELLEVHPHEMTMDRLPPTADLTLGLAYTGIDRLRLAAFAYNVLDQRYYQPDVFYNFEPRLELVPNPAPDFRFQIHASYKY